MYRSGTRAQDYTQHTAYCLFAVACCVLPIAIYKYKHIYILPTTYCLLHIAYCILPVALGAPASPAKPCWRG